MYTAVMLTLNLGQCSSDKRIIVLEANYGATKEQGCFEYTNSSFCDSTVETSGPAVLFIFREIME